jgi:hypothetical protein
MARKSVISKFNSIVSTVVLAIAVAMVAMVPTAAMAQGRGFLEGDRPSAGGPRRQLATIIYSGLGGAVLGLSTLSFYGRPQDKLSNIAVGFAVGVIVGTIAVTYSAATNPDEFYGLQDGATDRTLFPISNRELLGPENERTVLAARFSESQAVSFELPVLSF